MDTCLDMSLAAAYTSHSQRARVVTEDWVERNMYCPRCGSGHLEHLKANRPVAAWSPPLATTPAFCKRCWAGARCTPAQAPCA